MDCQSTQSMIKAQHTAVLTAFDCLIWESPHSHAVMCYRGYQMICMNMGHMVFTDCLLEDCFLDCSQSANRVNSSLAFEFMLKLHIQYHECQSVIENSQKKCHYFSYSWHFHSGLFIFIHIKMDLVSNGFFCRFNTNVQQSCREKSLKRQTLSLIVKNPTAYVFVNFFLVMCEKHDPVGQSFLIFGICCCHYCALHLHIHSTKKLRVILGKKTQTEVEINKANEECWNVLNIKEI